MFVLVQWEDAHTISVLPIEQTKQGKGNKTLAKWGATWYKAKILKTSENKEWLETLEVTTEGCVVSAEKRSSISETLLLKKREVRQKDKDTENFQKSIVMDQNKTIMHKVPIFRRVIAERCSDEDTNPNKDDEIEPPITSSSSEDEEEEEGRDSSINVESTPTSNYVIQKGHCICSKLPSVTTEDIENLSQVLNLAKLIHITQNQGECAVENQKATVLSQRKENGVMELVQGSGIYLSAFKVNQIQQLYKKNPREQVRQLMRLILGNEVLKKSSATGKNGWTPIPTNIFDGVERYVNENAIKRKYKLSHKKYREVVTAMCATLRNPKESSKAQTTTKNHIKRNVAVVMKKSLKESTEKGIPTEQDLEETKRKDIESENEKEIEQSEEEVYEEKKRKEEVQESNEYSKKNKWNKEIENKITGKNKTILEERAKESVQIERRGKGVDLIVPNRSEQNENVEIEQDEKEKERQEEERREKDKRLKEIKQIEIRLRQEKEKLLDETRKNEIKLRENSEEVTMKITRSMEKKDQTNYNKIKIKSEKIEAKKVKKDQGREEKRRKLNNIDNAAKKQKLN